MSMYTLRLDLKSDAAFGRGDGIAGLLDMEVQHDEYGRPFLAGRTVKGLLAEECANILFALECAGQAQPWLAAADALFGVSGSTPNAQGSLTVGNAQWPASVRAAVRAAVEAGTVTREEVLNAAGVLRRQTALDGETDSPLQETLRTVRVLVRGMQLEAEIGITPAPRKLEADPRQAALLAACVRGLRRAGTGRNRGRGELVAALLDAEGNPAADPWDRFVREVAS